MKNEKDYQNSSEFPSNKSKPDARESASGRTSTVPEYRYLYRDIPEETKAAIAAMTPGEMGHEQLELGEIWRKQQNGLIAACLNGEEMQRKKESGAFRNLMRLLPNALLNIQLQLFIQEVYGKQPSINTFLWGLEYLGKALKVTEGDKDQDFLSGEFRDFLKKGEKFRDVQRANLFDVFLWPVLFAVIWFGLSKLFAAPFVAELLAKEFWSGLAMGVLSILSLVFIVVLCMSGMNFFLSIIAAVFWVALAAFGGTYLFLFALKLTPAVAANLAEVPIESMIMISPLWLILVVVTVVVVVKNIRFHRKAWNKDAKLKKAREELEPLLAKTREDRQLYGLILEMAELSLTRLRKKDGAKELRVYSEKDAMDILEPTQQYFQPLCEKYDGIQKALEQS